MRHFKVKNIFIIALVIIIVASVGNIAIRFYSVAKTEKTNYTPFLSTNIIDENYGDVGNDYLYYSYGGAIYTYKKPSIFNKKLIIKRITEQGSKTIAKVDEKYDDNYISVFDEEHLILRRDKTLVVYNIEDETEHVLTELDRYYSYYGRHPIACRSDGIYFRKKAETGNLSVDDDETNTVYSILRYSPHDGVEEEIHRYSGEFLSITSQGIWYEEEGKILFFSFEDFKKTTLDPIEWPKCSVAMFPSNFMYSSDYIVRLADSQIDIYDIKTGETKVIFANSGFLQLCAFMTDKELCFSQWAVDAANWPQYKETDGTYRYTFETGVLEKISDEDSWYLGLFDERTLWTKTTFGFSYDVPRKVKLLGKMLSS